jgi:hypothetical protein
MDLIVRLREVDSSHWAKANIARYDVGVGN